MRAIGNAYFAVKQKSNNPKVAPILVAIVESYDDAIKVATYKNERVKAQGFYPTIHHA